MLAEDSEVVELKGWKMPVDLKAYILIKPKTV